MCIVLLEAADTCEASQGSRQLVSVQDAKVGHAEGQLSPGARAVIKHQTGSRQRGETQINTSAKTKLIQSKVITTLLNCFTEV